MNDKGRSQQAELLHDGLLALDLDVPASCHEQLLAFLVLLSKWNRAYNLTAVTEPREMVTRHLLDSLSISPYLRAPEILDVGTGAGLPGLPLAMIRPQDHFTLLDSNSKKTRFIQQVVAELGIMNVTVVHSRIEDFSPSFGFPCVVARAVTSLKNLLAQTAHLVAKGGMLVAMKGSLVQDEIEALPQGLEEVEVVPIQVPGLNESRYVVLIKPPSS